ncbi:plasmid pRiA4b ORF-3 family protein [Enterobacter roggenkampii]|uniref:plasmid pRiA4b ORF-3 family protein n=1 Tax=Enterobacter roggenkampii TaxID=1812935 RepID=UPI002FF59111
MYQLKITIRDSKPPIWRRVLVPEQIPFSELHAVIQLAFGWNDEHLYMFEKGRKGDLGSEYCVWGEGESMGNAAITPLWAAIQNEGDKLVYTYDFGDWWDCLIVLEKQTHDTSIQPVSCLRGRGTTPAENSGGLHGYNELLLQAREYDNPEQAEIRNFLMLDIERRVYDLNNINNRLQALN